MVPPLTGVKRFVKQHAPAVAAAYDQARTYWRAREWRGVDMTTAFHRIYQRNFWGDAESASGDGSALARTATIRRELPGALVRLGVRSMLDAPCGDLNWVRHTPLALDRYVGMDIVPELIERNQRLHGSAEREFRCGDLCASPLPEVDAILCRDCLVHFAFADVFRALRTFRASGARYLLTTTFTTHAWNVDIFTGHWRPINLQRPPFSFPAPLLLLPEDYADIPHYADKHLAVWRLSDLPLGDAA